MTETCHLRCDTCKSQVVYNTLGECLDKIKCSQDGGPLDDTCRIALKADGKPVFSIHREINDDYIGKTNTSGIVKESKPEPKVKESKKKKSV